MSLHSLSKDITGKKLAWKWRINQRIAFSGWRRQRRDLCTHLFLVKRGHPTSSTLISAVHAECASQFLFFFHSIFFFISIISCSFPAAFSCTACHSPLSSVWSLSSSAPWKRSASWQKCTSAHTRPYSLQKGQSIWIFLFQAAPRWHGERKKKHKTGSVWQKPLLFIDWETRMTEWLTHLH